MRLVRMLALMIMALALISGCEFLSAVFGTASAVEEYFPLTNGASWTMTGDFVMYDSTGTQADPSSSVSASVRLFVSGTKEVGGVTCAVLKVDQFSISEADTETLAEINDMLDGFEVYAAHTSDGLSIFGGSALVSSEYTDSYGNLSSTESLINGTITGGIPIIPNRMMTAESIDADASFENTNRSTDSTGALLSEQTISTVMTSSTTVAEEGTEVSTSAGTFSCAVIENATDIVNTSTYQDSSMSSPSTSTQNIAVDTTLSVARGVGLVKAVVNLDFGDGEDNSYMPKQITLELTSYSGL